VGFPKLPRRFARFGPLGFLVKGRIFEPCPLNRGSAQVKFLIQSDTLLGSSASLKAACDRTTVLPCVLVLLSYQGTLGPWPKVFSRKRGKLNRCNSIRVSTWVTA